MEFTSTLVEKEINDLLVINKHNINEEEVNAVDARNLHKFLNVKEKFNEWAKRYLSDDSEYGFVINSDFCRSTCLATNGRKMETYLLTIDTAKELSMISKTEKGRLARKYFIDCEKKLKTIQTSLPDFTNPAEMARVWADQYEKNLLLEQTVAEQKPKVEYFDAIVDRNLLCSFRESSKSLNVPERKFINFLEENKYIFRDAKKKIQPYAQFVPSLFEVKEWKTDHKAGQQTMITPKGRETFRLLTEHLKK